MYAVRRETFFFISLVLKCSRIQYRSKVTRHVHKNRYFTEQKIYIILPIIFYLYFSIILRFNCA